MSEHDDTNVVALARPDISPKDPAKEINVEYGVGSALPMGSWTNFLLGKDENEAGNKNTLSIDQLVEMRKKDGQARALLRLLTLPIRKAASEAEWVAPEAPDTEQKKTAPNEPVGESEKNAPAKDKEPESPVEKEPTDEAAPAQEEAAPEPGYGDAETDFANLMWTLPPYQGGMSVSWSKLVPQICLGLFEGFAAFEEVRYIPDTGPNKGKIVLKKLAHRDARTIKFLVDDKGGFNGIRQLTTVKGEVIDVKIKPDKCWYYAANEEENPYYGVSYFEAAYFHHDIKKRLYYISHLAAQFAAVPARVGKLPEKGSVDPVKLNSFKTALENFAFNTAMTVPQGYDVDLLNMNSSFDFLKLIDHHNSQMSKSVLAKFLDDEQRQVLIENSGADASADLFLMAVESIIHEIEESLTHYVMPKYMDWNFGTGIYPKLKFGALNDSQRDVIKDLFVALGTTKEGGFTPEFFRELEKKLSERLGLDVDYEAVDQREKQEAAEEEEQKKKEAELFERQYAGPGGGFGGPQEEPGFGE